MVAITNISNVPQNVSITCIRDGNPSIVSDGSPGTCNRDHKGVFEEIAVDAYRLHRLA